MTPAEQIASNTWHRLGQAQLYGVSFSEETLTDLLVLGMIPHQRMKAFSIRHPTKPLESMIGADLLIWIRYPKGRGCRLAVQAKKLYPSGRYDALSRKDSSGILQIDKLEKFSQRCGAIPAYLLYNYEVLLPLYRCHWHCCKQRNNEQFGCTLVPSWLIRKAINIRGGRTFPAIHVCDQTRPWRCVFDCLSPLEQVDVLALTKPELQIEQGEALWKQERVEWVQSETTEFDSLFEMENQLSIEEFNRHFANFDEEYDENLAGHELTYPRRILAIDVEEPGRKPEIE